MGIRSRRLRRRAIAEHIGKLTNSILEVSTNKSYDTEIKPFTATDAEKLNLKQWVFDWKKEFNQNKEICHFYKLTLKGDKQIQGIIELLEERNVIVMPLIESINYNQGKSKKYHGVAGNPVAYACKLSMDKGFNGYVNFRSKNSGIEHYKKTLGAKLLLDKAW
jgi:hypothetical protein